MIAYFVIIMLSTAFAVALYVSSAFGADEILAEKDKDRTFLGLFFTFAPIVNTLFCIFCTDFKKEFKEIFKRQEDDDE